MHRDTSWHHLFKWLSNSYSTFQNASYSHCLAALCLQIRPSTTSQRPESFSTRWIDLGQEDLSLQTEHISDSTSAVLSHCEPRICRKSRISFSEGFGNCWQTEQYFFAFLWAITYEAMRPDKLVVFGICSSFSRGWNDPKSYNWFCEAHLLGFDMKRTCDRQIMPDQNSTEFISEPRIISWRNCSCPQKGFGQAHASAYDEQGARNFMSPASTP